MSFKHIRPLAVVRKKHSNPYRRFASRALVSAALASVPATAHAAAIQPAQREAQALAFDIAPASLDEALRQFEAITGVSIDLRVPADVVAQLESPGVTGVRSWRNALDGLLEGTGLSARTTPAGGVAVDVTPLRESVEVTAAPLALSTPKLPGPVRDVPQTVTVITSAVMAEQGATTLRDVLRNVTGITFQAGEGGVPAGDTLTMRGFSARTDMFVDGVRDVGGYSRDAFNLEQVEVAKGPSSALAGRGSTGGAINQVSKAPTLQSSSAASMSAGTAGHRRGTLDVNQPLAALPIPGAALRVNAMWTDTGTPHRDVVHAARWGVAPVLGLGTGTHTRATLGYYTLRQDNVPDYGLPWVPANSNPALQAFANGAPPVDQANYYGLRARDYERTVTDVATLDIAQDIGSASTLRTLSRWGRTRRDSVITAPRFASVETSTAITRQLQSRDMTDAILTTQTNLTSRVRTGAAAHVLSAGLELAAESSENFARVGPVAPLADLFAPDARAAYAGPVVRTGARTRGTASSLAAYAFDTVAFGQRWELSGGARWDRFAVDHASIAATGEATPLSRVDAMTSVRGGIVFTPHRQGRLYAGYSTAFNPSAEGLALTAVNVTLAPEQTRHAEAGSKWDLFRQRLSATAAVFRTEKINARTPGLNAGDPATVLAGRQWVSGVELGLSGRLRSWWSGLANYTFMRSRIAASNTAAERDQNLALTPRHTASVWTTFALPGGAGLGGGAQFMDSVFRNATNTARVPSYWLLSATASYEVNSHLTLRLNGTNLTDRRYVDRVGGGHYLPGPGRQVMLTAAVAR